jgi:predicted DNA-binding protein (UPF0251 family)
MRGLSGAVCVCWRGWPRLSRRRARRASVWGRVLVLRWADRETLLLVVWGELTYEEAAAAVGVPVGTVRSRISRARRQLRLDIPERASATNDQTGEAHA